MKYKAIVYGRTDPPCKYCTAAKAFLTSREIPFDYIDIGKDITKEEFLEIVPSAKSVPQIFIETEEEKTLVGGFDALLVWVKINGVPL